LRPLYTTDRVAELESVVTSLEGQLEEQSRDADNAIAQWQESYSALEARDSESLKDLEDNVSRLQDTLHKERTQGENLVSNLEMAEAKFKKTQHGLESLMADLRLEQGKIEGLEGALLERDEELAEEREEATAAITEWESCCKDLEDKIAAMEGALGAVTGQRDEFEDTLKAERTLYKKLSAKYEEVKAQLPEESAKDVDSSDAWVEEVTILRSQLEEERQGLLLAKKELADFTADSGEAVNLWKGEY